MTAEPTYKAAVYTVVSLDGGETAEYVQAGIIEWTGTAWRARGAGQDLGEHPDRQQAEIAVRRAWWGPAEPELFNGADAPDRDD